MLKLVDSLSGHKGKVWSVAWDYQGNCLASCGEDKTVNVWTNKNNNSSSAGGDNNELKNSSSSWSVSKKFGENHERTIRDVAWSPCGKFIAVASFDATISIWEQDKATNEFECVTTVEGHENEVKSVAWSPSGQYFASCGRDKNVMIWSMSQDGQYDIECESVLSLHSQDVKRVVWHPHEDILVSASYDDTIKFYKNDPNDGDWTCFNTLEGHESTVWAVDFDSTGNRLVSVSDDRTLRIWIKSSVDSKWSCASKLEGYHDRSIYDVSWHKINGLIATACGDDSIRVFKETPAVNETEKNIFELIHTQKAHSADVNRVQWNPKIDGLLASSSDDGLVKIWNWVDI